MSKRQRQSVRVAAKTRLAALSDDHALRVAKIDIFDLLVKRSLRRLQQRKVGYGSCVVCFRKLDVDIVAKAHVPAPLADADERIGARFQVLVLIERFEDSRSRFRRAGADNERQVRILVSADLSDERALIVDEVKIAVDLPDSGGLTLTNSRR